jgi:hypothetical protein
MKELFNILFCGTEYWTQGLTLASGLPLELVPSPELLNFYKSDFHKYNVSNVPLQ